MPVIFPSFYLCKSSRCLGTKQGKTIPRISFIRRKGQSLSHIHHQHWHWYWKGLFETQQSTKVYWKSCPRLNNGSWWLFSKLLAHRAWTAAVPAVEWCFFWSRGQQVVQITQDNSLLIKMTQNQLSPLLETVLGLICGCILPVIGHIQKSCLGQSTC